MSRSASQTTTTAPAEPPSRYQAPRAGQALGAFTAGGARAPDRTWGVLHTAVRDVFPGRCRHCGPAAPALGQRTARTPVSSGFRLDFCRSVRKPRKRALCLFPVPWLQPWLPFPFRRGVPTLLPRCCPECTSLGQKLFGLQGEGLLSVHHPVSHLGQGTFSAKAQGVNILAKSHPSYLLKK